MAAPTSTNEVTARRLASVISQLWSKIKETFAAKSHSHQISDVTDLQDSIDSRMSKDGTNSTTDSLANIITKGDYYTKDSFPSTSGYIAQVGLSFRNSSTNTNKTIRMNLNDFEGKLKDDIGAWPTASAAASGSALETSINGKQDELVKVFDYQQSGVTYDQLLALIKSNYDVWIKIPVQQAVSPSESETTNVMCKYSGIYYGGPRQGTYVALVFNSSFRPDKNSNIENNNFNIEVRLTSDNVWLSGSVGIDATMITTGTIDPDRIPTMDASKIATGTFNSRLIPNLDASKITSGTFSDSRIASASIWNGKQDALPTSYPSSGMTSYYIRAREAQEVIQNDRGDLFFEYLGTTKVLKITMPSGTKTDLSSILVQTVAADGWPLIFMVGWNWSGSAFTKEPKLSYLYTTSQNTSSADKHATIKYSVDSIFIKVNQTQTSRKMMVSIIGGNIGDLNITNSDEDAEYNAATLVSGGNVEGCVMKMDVGSAVGSASQPVYVEASGFVKACTSVNAVTWNGMSGNFSGSIPSTPAENTIYWV